MLLAPQRQLSALSNTCGKWLGQWRCHPSVASWLSGAPSVPYHAIPNHFLQHCQLKRPVSSSLTQSVRVFRSLTKTPEQLYRYSSCAQSCRSFHQNSATSVTATSTMGPMTARSRAQHGWSIWMVEEEVIISQHLAAEHLR